MNTGGRPSLVDGSASNYLVARLSATGCKSKHDMMHRPSKGLAPLLVCRSNGLEGQPWRPDSLFSLELFRHHIHSLRRYLLLVQTGFEY